MKKTKLFFVACWALMLALDARANTANSRNSNVRNVASTRSDQTVDLTLDEMRGIVEQLLVSQGIYNLENAAAYVHTLKPEEVQAMAQSAYNKNLIRMSDTTNGEAKPFQMTFTAQDHAPVVLPSQVISN